MLLLLSSTAVVFRVVRTNSGEHLSVCNPNTPIKIVYYEALWRRILETTSYACSLHIQYTMLAFFVFHHIRCWPAKVLVRTIKRALITCCVAFARGERVEKCFARVLHRGPGKIYIWFAVYRGENVCRRLNALCHVVFGDTSTRIYRTFRAPAALREANTPVARDAQQTPKP